MPRRPKKRARVGWESLTDAERRVAALVATGLTDREIAERFTLSVRTVQTHVAHVRAKLGASSRRELSQEVRRHDPKKGEL